MSYLKPGNERLGAVIVSRLVPVWLALGLSNDLFKGLTGRAGDVHERAEDEMSRKSYASPYFPHLTVFHIMPFWQHTFPCFPSSNSVTNYKSISDLSVFCFTVFCFKCYVHFLPHFSKERKYPGIFSTAVFTTDFPSHRGVAQNRLIPVALCLCAAYDRDR